MPARLAPLGSANGSAGGWAAPGAAACPAGAGLTSSPKGFFGSTAPAPPLAPARRRFLLLLERHGKRRPVLPALLRAHVVPSNEEGDRLGVVNRLNGHGRRGRMERASGLHDLPDDRKAGRRRGREARGPFGQVDGIQDVLGDDEVGIAGPAAPRERVDEVRDRPSLLGLEGSSRNPGMGVPLSPVLIDRKISSRDEPPRKVQLCVRSAGRIGCPQSSFRVGAEGPSPRPSVPWHLMQPVSS